MELGLVSVIVPSFNAAQFITETLDAILSQSYKHLELLVIDDCSTDNTVEVVKRRQLSDKRLRLLVQKQNSGPAVARQSGISAAAGQYIAFCDSDDVWLKDKLQLQISALSDNSRSALCFTQFRRVDSNAQRVGRLIDVPRCMSYNDYLKNTAIATSTVVIDLQKTGPIAVKKTWCDDFVLWTSVLKRGFTALGLKQDLMRYRVRSGSWSRNKFRYAWWVWLTYRRDENLGFFRAFWCFSHYAWHGVLKYSRF